MSGRAAHQEAELAAELREGRRAVAIRNARLVCPTPSKVSLGSPTSAYAAAEAVSRRTGVEWEPVACYCLRFHIRPAPACATTDTCVMIGT